MKKLAIPDDVPLDVSQTKVDGMTAFRFAVEPLNKTHVVIGRRAADAFVQGFLLGWSARRV